ncbi:hypothetical protein CPB84DRAFT_1829734 [Gymnopilus junonius]|uniref:Uncharacterized protein n=1 Tax=Gymnopilus junonius TaxID=109634 RepID=A0A9P5N7M4_GYMJU|nr:hypothetical protein CPB84DRAFT_1829734 [Gymnopilus junonius]
MHDPVVRIKMGSGSGGLSQCVKITKALIQGFLQLVVIYRDHEERRPLLPWLLGTEVVEHAFGMCRQIVKDFTMLDFHLMIPKLFIKLREAFFSACSSDGKARASGYSHTHTDIRGIDLLALSTYPSNADIQESANRAYNEAHSLFVYLGLTAEQLYSATTRLPSILSWWTDDDADADAQSDSESSESDDDYQAMLDQLEDVELPSRRENELMNYRFAAVALSIDDQTTICDLPELDDEAIVEAYSDDASHIQSILSDIAAAHGERLANSLPPVNIQEPEADIYSSNMTEDIDLSELVRLRVRHQTKQAETGVRKTGNSEALTNQSKAKSLTERQQLLRKFSEIIKQEGDRGIGTGLDRNVRWTASGNSANATAVAKTTATKALTKRKKIFHDAQLPETIGDARVNGLNVLHAADARAPSGTRAAGSYGFAMSSNKNLGLVLCKVLTVYSKGGGKNGKHGYVDSVSSVAAASNIVIQVFQYHFGSRFYDKPHMSHPFPQLYCFDIIPSTLFLCTLHSSPIAGQLGLEVSSEDITLFKALRNKQEEIGKAIKVFNQRKKTSNSETVDVDDDDEDIDG